MSLVIAEVSARLAMLNQVKPTIMLANVILFNNSLMVLLTLLCDVRASRLMLFCLVARRVPMRRVVYFDMGRIAL
jgi:hypothetical protein